MGAGVVKEMQPWRLMRKRYMRRGSVSVFAHKAAAYYLLASSFWHSRHGKCMLCVGRA